MKRVMVFVVAFAIGIAACLFIVGDIQVFGWRQESRFALIFFPLIFAGLVAACPYLDLD